MGQVLNAYQFWLDELFPKAKFADGLSIIEALGHKKTMQISRTAWIDEDRHIAPPSDDEHGDAVSSLMHERIEPGYLNAQDGIRNVDSHHDQGGRVSGEHPEIGDDLDELMVLAASHTQGQYAMARGTPDLGRKERPADLFADEEEAMADTGW